MIDGWKKNIASTIRLRIFIRNWCIKNIYNPYQVFRRKRGWADGDLFRHILIQTNYLCTRRCSFCHYGLETPPTNVEMDEKLYHNIIDQLKALNYKGRLGPFEMNEPLTDKRIQSFLRYARQQLSGAWLFLTTNGDLLNPGDIESLFANGLNYLYLNSYDKEACRRNLELLNDLDPKIRKKVKHIDRTYQTSWTSRGGNVKQFQKQVHQKSCDMIYSVLYIKPTGKVYACYNDYYDVNEMGDLNTQTVSEVWFGQTFLNLRKELNKGNRNHNKLCAQCDYIGYTNLPETSLSWKIKKRFLGSSR